MLQAINSKRKSDGNDCTENISNQTFKRLIAIYFIPDDRKYAYLPQIVGLASNSEHLLYRKYMCHIQLRLSMIDRRLDTQESIISQRLHLSSFCIVTIAAVNPLVSACLRYLVCPIHSVYVPYSVTLNDDRL